MKYCEWLTEKLEERGILGLGQKISLSTEAQWEYAARGKDGRVFPWGDEIDPNRANYGETGIGTTSPVGCFPAGATTECVFDMGGNAYEWCADWFGQYSKESDTDPTGPKSAVNRVLRGGSWIRKVSDCRVANRHYYYPDLSFIDFGFRLALVPK